MIVRSAKYLAGSRGAPCTLRIGGVCTGDVETVVPCHVRDRHTGRSQKASDLTVVDGCHACHAVFDGRAKMPNGQFITEYEWNYYALRATHETQERRVELGLLVVAGFDPKAPPKPKTVQPRKPKADRKPMMKRPFAQGHRPLKGRNNFKTKGDRKWT